MRDINKEYCTCEDSKGVHTELDGFGYWDTCSECNKPLEDGFHYYDEPDCY